MSGVKPFTVGITGGMATGKSSLVRILRVRGAACYSLDEAAHELYLPGRPVHRALMRAFGRRILAPDGTINRSLLGRRVFRKPYELTKLNGIMHARLREMAARAVEGMRSPG